MDGGSASGEPRGSAPQADAPRHARASRSLIAPILRAAPSYTVTCRSAEGTGRVIQRMMNGHPDRTLGWAFCHAMKCTTKRRAVEV